VFLSRVFNFFFCDLCKFLITSFISSSVLASIIFKIFSSPKIFLSFSSVTFWVFNIVIKNTTAIEGIFDVHEANNLENLIDKNTKAIIFESVANPALTVPDFDTITQIADKKEVITICDNTIATSYGCQPIQFGVDIVVHSASKYIVGNGSAIAGVIVESKKAKTNTTTT
jgi:O-acetylhomoserine/O-acetylserine sulfhydrylase-like pyridoxal-dependent enzyme